MVAAGQIQAHCSASSDLSVNGNLPTRLPCKAVDHREPKPSAFSQRFSCKKWLEYMGRNIGGHANAGIADAQTNVLAGYEVSVARCFFVKQLVRGLNAQ